MRITESKLREVIRQVIRESMHDDIDIREQDSHQCKVGFVRLIESLCSAKHVYDLKELIEGKGLSSDIDPLSPLASAMSALSACLVEHCGSEVLAEMSEIMDMVIVPSLNRLIDSCQDDLDMATVMSMQETFRKCMIPKADKAVEGMCTQLEEIFL